MTATKVLVVVLVLIAVLFLVLVIWGAGNNGSAKADPTSFNADSYPLVGKLGGLFGSSTPTLKAGDLTPDPPPLRPANGVVPPAGKFVLSTGDQPTRFDVVADSNDQFRQATFTVSKQGCAEIDYQTADHSGGTLSDQDWPSEGSDPKNPTRAKFQILSPKGFLTVTFKMPGCTVQLE